MDDRLIDLIGKLIQIDVLFARSILLVTEDLDTIAREQGGKLEVRSITPDS